MSACVTLYSETRDNQGKASKEAWQKVDLAAQIATPRKNHAALLAKQLELEESLAKARRDQLARAIATGGTVEDQIANPIRADLKRVAESRANASAWLDALDAEIAARKSLQKFETEFTRFGVEMPPCAKLPLPDTQSALATWLAAHPTARPVMEPTVIQATIACGNKNLTATQSLSLGTSDLQRIRDEVAKATADLAALRARGLNERNLFRAAKAEYDAAAAALEVDPSASRDKVQAAAKKLQGLASTLSTFQDAFSVKFISEEQQKSLNQLLTTILDTPSGQAPPADSSKAAVALVLLPALLDSSRTALADAKKPSLVPFVLAKDLAQIHFEAASRDIDAQQALIELLQQKLYWQTERARALRDASINVDGAVGADGRIRLAPLDKRILSSTAFDALSPISERPKPDDTSAKKELDDKIRLWKATAFYLDAQGRLKAEVGKIDYQVNALQYEGALAYAESNIRQWNVLITTSVDQMAAFGASGIKKEDIIALLNSLTLLWIGKGVN